VYQLWQLPIVFGTLSKMSEQGGRMIIDFDGRELTVPAHVEQELINQLFDMFVEKIYPMVPLPGQLLMMHWSRGKLKDIEQASIKAGYDPVKVRSAVRPPPGGDPNLLYLRIMLADSLREMEHAVIEVATIPETDTITSLTIQPVGES
jgi:hypothetical protein